MFSLLLLSLKSIARGQHSGHVGQYGPSPYHYEYKVQDDKEYLDFGAQEEGDGQGDVHGEYHVQLPDGRLQHVSYHVDDYNGYIAEVSYDGHAEHPSHHGHGYHGGKQRFGKTLIHNNAGASLPISVAKISSEEFNDGKGKAIGQQKFVHGSNKVAKEPFLSFPSSGVFNNRFAEPSGSSGTFHDEPNKQFNSIFSKKPVEPLESSLFPKSLEQFGNGFIRRPIEPQHSFQLSESFGQNVVSPENEQFK